ncbi:cytochrome P450 2D27-like [Acanthaster planci]|uniref:Cytochrome P450 2D27-like n=1 Tax=Acanthaster planci TaxID=133434 RepID=A0A8B7ZBK5_ACAPL|nr:cytochrome P450 2D27-like [Acanthaster planci]
METALHLDYSLTYLHSFSFVLNLRLALVFTATWLAVWVLQDQLGIGGRVSRSVNLPPGPWGWPVLGILPSLGVTAPHQRLAEFATKYGGVFTCYFGGHRVVVLGNYDCIVQALGKSGDVFSDRPRLTMFTEVGGGRGVAGAYFGKQWKEQRAWTFNILRGLGLGKDNFESNITEEVGHLCDRVNAYQSEAFDPCLSLNTAVSNIICSIVYGTRFDYDNTTFKRLLTLLQENFELVGLAGVVNFFPVLKHIPLCGFGKFLANVRELNSCLFSKSISDHRLTFDQGRIRDFIDAYLNEMCGRDSGENEVGSSSFTEENLTWVIGDLFAVGTETTALTLRWALLYMVTHTNVQQKVQQELDEVVGRTRLPSLEERPRLNYTHAVINEIQRVRYIAAITVPRATTEDTKLNGYDIPKGTTIMPVMWAVMHDPKVWPHPDEFQPERFLDDRGQYHKPEHFLPYGTGRRMCPGERLARMELFLFFTHLLHRFSFSLPLGAPQPSLSGRMGITLAPQPYHLVARSRPLKESG